MPIPCPNSDHKKETSRGGKQHHITDDDSAGATQVEAVPANMNTNTPNAHLSSELPPLLRMHLTQPGTIDSLSCPSVASLVRALNALQAFIVQSSLICSSTQSPCPWGLGFGEGVFAFKLSPEFPGPV